MTVVRIGELFSFERLPQGLLLVFRSFREGCFAIVTASSAFCFDPGMLCWGTSPPIKPMDLFPVCNFQMDSDSEQRLLLEPPFSVSFSSKLTPYREEVCLPTMLPALLIDRMQVQPWFAVHPCQSENLRLPWGHDYLNHWSSSFRAIQIQVSVKRLSSYESLPADLFESPRDFLDRLFVNRLIYAKDFALNLLDFY